MEHKKYNAINQPVRKKDSMQLLLGKPVYVEDIVPKDALALKLLRSPHANAIVEEINVSVAKKVPGVVDIYTWEDVPKQRFAIAGHIRHLAQHQSHIPGLIILLFCQTGIVDLVKGVCV